LACKHATPPALVFYSISMAEHSMAAVRAEVRGIALDSQTRCGHYRSALDIIAIKMKCCGFYYACRDCHDALAGHEAQLWPRDEWNRPAVMCGSCGIELSIHQYLECSNRCPGCSAAFNPGCRNHYHLYFAAGAAAL